MATGHRKQRHRRQIPVARAEIAETGDLLKPDERKPEIPTEFAARCRAVADAAERTGTRIRIILTADGGAEPFMIHARYEINSRMHVYGQTKTETAISDALEATGASRREFLREAAETGRRTADAGTPPPVVWDEPALVIGGMAPGTVTRWRKRRAECGNTARAEG